MISYTDKFMSIRTQIISSYIPYIKEKWAHAGFQKYLKNTSWLFAGQFSMIISLTVNIWLARYLGPTNFGILSYVIAFVGIFGFISGLGISDILVREIVKNHQKKDELLGTTFRLLSYLGAEGNDEPGSPAARPDDL